MLLVIKVHGITGQGAIGFATPCGEDNLSCPRIGNLSEIPLMCYPWEELCNGTEFCIGGSDEGRIDTINSLECKLSVKCCLRAG